MTSLHDHTSKKDQVQPEPLRVVELFAGVGGFRLGLEGKHGRSKKYRTVWFNQWEPGEKKQHAHEVYVKRFKARPWEVREKTNNDVAEVFKAAQRGDFNIPDHEVLVGGFPCQDYSVARTLSQASGIAGKKGVLWWEIHNILKHKIKEGKPVKYVFLENVDRLLKSPTSRRGRDFAMILATLSDLGYDVEWKVINAADYGMPQRRRRTFIVGYHVTSPLHSAMRAMDPTDVLLKKGVLARSFRSVPKTSPIPGITIDGNPVQITEKFNIEQPEKSPFATAGVLRERVFYSVDMVAKHGGTRTVLGDILLSEKDIPEHFFVNGDLQRWKYLKGAKNEPRKSANGYEFTYTEGPMVFPDPHDKPSRTIITGEGGTTPSRFKHVVKTKSGKLRRLTPIELERLCMFPDDHTNIEGISDIRRAFFMGNALVVGVVKRIGASLSKMHNESLDGGANTFKRPIPSPITRKAARPHRHHSPSKAS